MPKKRGRPNKWIIYTGSCSGCYEFNEGLGQHRYDNDPKLNIKLGYGCKECGYSGKRRHVLSIEAVAKDQGMTVKEFNQMCYEIDIDVNP